MQRVVHYDFDAHDRLIARQKIAASPGNALTEYRRDRLGRITTVFDPHQNRWDYTYDALGRRTRVKDPDLGTWDYVYDAAGRLIRQTDARDTVTVIAYDAMGRVDTKTVDPVAGASEVTENIYDADLAGHPGFNLGKLIDARNGVTAIRYEHDIAGRLVKQTWINLQGPGEHRFIATSYWPGGEIKSRLLADPSQTATAGGLAAGPYAYDAAGRLTAIANGESTGPDNLIDAIAYNARGQTTGIAYGNNTLTQFAYTPGRSFLDNVLITRNGVTLLHLDYVRDLLGRVHRINANPTSESWQYAYDGLGPFDRGRHPRS